MDTKSKILIALFFALVVVATVWKYYVFITKQDFLIFNHISCDPTIESCFTYNCAERDVECDSTPFKKITKNAQSISICSTDDCPEISCAPGEAECKITSCSEDSVEDGEICSYTPIIISDEPVATSTDQTDL